MRKFLFAAAVAAVLPLVSNPGAAKASWLSDLLRGIVAPPVYYGGYGYYPGGYGYNPGGFGYYAPAYPAYPYGYGWSSYSYVPWGGYPTYMSPAWGYGPYRYPANGYWRPWYGGAVNPHAWHEMQEHRWHEWREHHRH